MEKYMKVRIEQCLENLRTKTIKITQIGFIVTQFFIYDLIYIIQNDILNLRDKTKEIYISINLKQVYKVEIKESNLILYLDNDTKIKIDL